VRAVGVAAGVGGGAASRRAFWSSVVFGFALMITTACSAQLEDAIAAQRAGKYSEAVAIYRRAVERDNMSVPAQKGLARALIDVGQYAEAEKTLRAAPASLATALAFTLGNAQRLQGRLKEAEASYRIAVEKRAPDSLSARANLAVLQYDRGERAAALDEFDKFIDIYNGGRTLSSEELVAVGLAVRYLGERDPQLFKDALLAYDKAIAADPNNLDARLRVAALFLEKYDSEQAQKAFQEALEHSENHPIGLLGMARTREFDGSAEAVVLATEALDINPNLVDARLVLARAALNSEDLESATSEVNKALAVNPNSLEALTTQAAIQHFAGDRAAFEATRTKILALNPRYADLYATLAELSVQTRQYARAVEFARQGVQIDSASFRSHGILGINLMRLGSIKEGRASLETAFKGDPYNVWFKNTLDLLDTMDRYREVDLGRFRIVIDPRESELLTPLVAELAEDAYNKLSARYKTQLQGPVRIELFNSHADFSVRTVGLAGLGALGAAFGNVLVMDSPSAREAGQFNWGTTLWHELAHAFHLALSEHKVPRWLTEGLASLEERRARPGWGEEIEPGFLAAYKADRLLPVSRLSQGFVRPTYPQQVQFSYYEASLVAEMIEQERGFNAILDMLRAYREGQSTNEVLRNVLKTEPAAFDKKFDQYLQQRFSKQLAVIKAVKKGADPSEEDLGDYATQLLLAQKLLQDKKYDEALPILERAKAMFPDYAGPESPYRLLADLYRAKGDLQKAAAELEQITIRQETDYEANLQLAEIMQAAGNNAGVAAALDRALYIYPMQPVLHTRLADAFQKLGDKAKVVRARRALVALNPVDKAEAYYQLALAYFEAGDAPNARREVLKALEEAPNFEKAQALLLRLRGT
jgi:cellulose synthase operon protein C